MALNVNKAIRAVRLVKKPALITELTGTYVLLRDASGGYQQMLKALNLLANYGWEAVSTSMHDGVMFALIKRSDQPVASTGSSAQTGGATTAAPAPAAPTAAAPAQTPESGQPS